MEYFGKILCISKADLTRDDRPDDSLENQYLAPIMSVSCFDQMAYKNRFLVVRKGIGRGVSSLVSVESLPSPYKEKVKSKYNNMSAEILRNWFGAHFEIDSEAMAFYSSPLKCGVDLTIEQRQEYTINASVLKAVILLMNDTKMQRAAQQNGRVKWEEMAGAISFYKKEFGHTLPLSPSRFRKRVNDFQKEGYINLISKKFGNQNTRLVNIHIERLLFGLATLPNRPYNTHVWDMYNQFVTGQLEVFDPQTGELFDPKQFADKEGNPIKLSKSTINNYLNQPKVKALIENKLMTWSGYMHKNRPHVHRHLPEYSLSKVTMDDRDLPRKIKEGGGLRPKVYYAYDVASGCVIGYSYKREKDVGLVYDCFRSMFRLLWHNGWGCPAQIEVENHLMSQFRDGFLKAGEVFDFVRFCAPLNSQEKHAEQFNGAKKRSIEHKNHTGVGRFYAKNWKYQVEYKKVSDETNDFYEDRKYYSWNELIADDMADVIEWNNSLHPNQKKYPDMSRWDVLKACINPDLKPLDLATISRYIGVHVETSIRRNSYCRVNYTDLWLSSPEILGKLAPNNYKVDAYYIPGEEGEMDNVFIYQKGRLIDKLKNVGTFNEADAEQTDTDRQIMREQNKLISMHDAMLKRDAIAPVAILKKETAARLETVETTPVEIPSEEKEINPEELLLKYSGDTYAALGRMSV